MKKKIKKMCYTDNVICTRVKVYNGFSYVGMSIRFKNEDIEKHFNKPIEELSRSEYLDLVSKKV